MDLSETNTELVDAVLNNFGLRRVGGLYGNVGPLLSYALMDAQYQLYDDFIDGIDLDWVSEQRVRTNIMADRSNWYNAYDSFNKQINRCWDTDQRDNAQTMMDSLEDYIHNDLIVLQVSAMNHLTHLNFKHQQIIATAVVCNILAQYAQIAWEAVYKSVSGKGMKNKKIQGVIDGTLKFQNSYYRAAGNTVDVVLESDKKFSDSVDILASKIVRWLNSYR